MTRYVCYMCKMLIHERKHLLTIKRSSSAGLNFECPNPSCSSKNGTVIAKLPPYLFRLRKAR